MSKIQKYKKLNEDYEKKLKDYSQLNIDLEEKSHVQQ